eukprot:bmy_18670T0
MLGSIAMPKNKGKEGKNRCKGKKENESKKGWCVKRMNKNILLVGLPDYQDNKADVISKYNADKAISLKAYGKLPKHAQINEKDIFGAGDDDTIQVGGEEYSNSFKDKKHVLDQLIFTVPHLEFN